MHEKKIARENSLPYLIPRTETETATKNHNQIDKRLIH